MRFLSFAGLLALLCLSTLGACGGSGGGGDDGLRVGVLHSDVPDYIADVVSTLEGTGAFASVQAVDLSASGGFPSLSQLQFFDVLLVYSDVEFGDPVALGDLLADYVDAGGALVLAVFAMNPTWSLDGRFETDDYYAIPESTVAGNDGPIALGTFDALHPILSGVSAFSGGTASLRPSGAGVHAQATEVASWSDGAPLVATRLVNGVRRVDLGFFPPSSAVDLGLWSGDGDLLLANALLWAAGAI
jgi:hypothetical protein